MGLLGKLHFLSGNARDRGDAVAFAQVHDFDALITHHPKANRNAELIDGRTEKVERPVRRAHAWIAGDFQEVEMRRTDEYGVLKPDQVLLIKDFILEDVIPGRVSTRAVDVPAPFS